MAYLRWGKQCPELGLNDDGIIDRADAQQVLALDAAASAILAEARECLDAARHEARSMHDSATAEADELHYRAEKERHAAARLGYWQGRKEAAREWQAMATAGHREAASLHALQRERMARIVVNAVRRLVHAAPAEDFFRAAMTHVDREAEEARRMVFFVHPDEVAAAQQAMLSLQSRWPAEMIARVEADASLTLRACRVETDIGYVDSSLDIQLEALAHNLKRLGAGAEAGVGPGPDAGAAALADTEAST